MRESRTDQALDEVEVAIDEATADLSTSELLEFWGEMAERAEQRSRRAKLDRGDGV